MTKSIIVPMLACLLLLIGCSASPDRQALEPASDTGGAPSVTAGLTCKPITCDANHTEPTDALDTFIGADCSDGERVIAVEKGYPIADDYICEAGTGRVFVVTQKLAATPMTWQGQACKSLGLGLSYLEYWTLSEADACN